MGAYRKSLFISSADRPKDASGNPVTGPSPIPGAATGYLWRFTVKVPPIVTNIKINQTVKVSVAQIQIPFPNGWVGAQAATPNTPGPAGQARFCKQIHLRSSLASQNISTSEMGYDTTIFKIPVQQSYIPALSSTDFSYVIYKANGETYNQTTLVEPNIDFLTFWLTDELGQPVIPAADWFLTLTIDVVDEFNPLDTTALLKQQVDTLKLLLLQGDIKHNVSSNGQVDNFQRRRIA